MTPSDPSDRRSEHPDEFGELRRLHPISLLFRALSAIRSFLLPFLAYVVLSGDFTNLLAFGPVVGFSVVAGLWSWLAFQYRITEDELVIVEGILSRNVRQIPLARIQNVSAVENVLHRALSVVEARIETASGQGAEAHLRVVTPAEVEYLRQRVFAARRAAGKRPSVAGEGAGDDQPAGRELVHVPDRDLLIYGTTRNRAAKIFAAGLGVAYEVGQAQTEWLERLGLGFLDRSRWPGLSEISSVAGSLRTIALAVSTIVLLLVVLNALSIGWAVIQLYGFRLTRDGDDMRSAFGLFTRHTASIPRHRVQSLAIRRPALFRWLDRFALSAETAGSDAASTSAIQRQWLTPISPIGQLSSLIGEVQPELDAPEAVPWNALADGARRRLFIRRCFVALLVVGALALIPAVRWRAGWLVLPVIALAWWEAGMQARHMGWALTDRAFWIKHGWWTQTRVAVRPSKVQVIDVRQNPFDRRRDMATIRVDTAGRSDAAHRVRLRYLPAEAARNVKAELAGRATETTFRW